MHRHQMKSDAVARALCAMLSRDPTVNQTRLAEAIGVDQSTVHRYCQGRSRGGLDLPAVLIPAVTWELGDQLVEVVCRLAGGRFIRDPEPDIESSQCVVASVAAVHAAAAYQVAAAEAEADGKVTAAEHERLLAEAQCLRAEADRRVVHHESALRAAGR